MAPGECSSDVKPDNTDAYVLLEIDEHVSKCEVFTCTGDVPYSNVARYTDYPETFHGLPLFLHLNTRTNRPRQLPSIHFSIFFYVRGSVHRESNLIAVQQDATYSVYYISVGSSTCFGC